MSKAEFTEGELAVLAALYFSMRGNGFDFGFTDECQAPGMTTRQSQGTFRELHKKIRFHIDAQYKQIYCDWPDGELPHATSFSDWLQALPRREK